MPMALTRKDGRATEVAEAGLDVMLLEQQLEALERPPDAKKPSWPWLLVVVGALLIAGLSVHGYTAYATLVRIDTNSKVDSPNPFLRFQDIATNGPRVGSTIETSSRSTYTRSLEQFVLDGTGIGVGLVLIVAGFFIRANR
jgi:hypothetical protein